MPAPKARNHADRIAELREGRGWSYKRIGQTIGTSPGAVSWYCLMHGIESPIRQPTVARNPGPAVIMRGGLPVRRFGEDEDRRLLELEARQLSYSEIGRRLDRPANSIRGRLATLARRDARREEAGL